MRYQQINHKIDYRQIEGANTEGANTEGEESPKQIDAYSIQQSQNHDVHPKEPRTITKRDICDALYWSLGHVSRRDVAALFDEVLEEIVAELSDGEDVKLHEFGKFKVRWKKQRIGRNPRSGVEAIISGRRVVTFIASPNMRSRIERGE